jgi:putative ABC transport system permease protein
MSPLHLAWRNLLHQPLRTFISLAGVAFAVVLLFMQLGFLGSVDVTATQLYDHLEFDLLLVSSEYLDLNRPGNLPRERLAQARVEGVNNVVPLTVGVGLWHDPRPDVAIRRQWNIMMLGVEPAQIDRVFGGPGRPIYASPGTAAEAGAALARVDTVLLDQQSWPQYGEPEQRRPGSRVELNGRRVEVSGSCSVGTGFGYNGLLITSEESYHHLTGQRGDRVTFGLVQLAAGARPSEVKAALARKLPRDVQVLTRAEIYDQEQTYWRDSTAVGRFFSLAVLIALAVGGVFVYQIMASDIRNHLAEYATVKALGYRGSFLAQVVFAQAVLLGLIGYLPGMVAALGLYALTQHSARIPIGMSIGRGVLVLLLTLGMCLGSGLLATRKLHSADPADLF